MCSHPDSPSHPGCHTQNIEQSSLCYTVGPCWFSILNIAECTCPSSSADSFVLLFLFIPLCAPHLYKMLRKPKGSCLRCRQASKAIVVSSQEYANSHPSLPSNLNLKKKNPGQAPYLTLWRRFPCLRSPPSPPQTLGLWKWKASYTLDIECMLSSV